MSELDEIRDKAVRLRRACNDYTPSGFFTLAKLIEELCDVIEAQGIEAERFVHTKEASRA